MTSPPAGIAQADWTTAGLQEIEDRMTARAFIAVHNPEQGPAVRETL